jgi:ABC-type multidrug transport system permease subunit
MLFGRRIRFAIIILASQLLLISLAVVMLIQMILIATNGVVQFVENNPIILTIELILTILITSFGVFVFIIQLRRLGEKRNSDSQDRENASKYIDCRDKRI